MSFAKGYDYDLDLLLKIDPPAGLWISLAERANRLEQFDHGMFSIRWHGHEWYIWYMRVNGPGDRWHLYDGAREDVESALVRHVNETFPEFEIISTDFVHGGRLKGEGMDMFYVLCRGLG